MLIANLPHFLVPSDMETNRNGINNPMAHVSARAVELSHKILRTQLNLMWAARELQLKMGIEKYISERPGPKTLIYIYSLTAFFAKTYALMIIC